MHLAIKVLFLACRGRRTVYCCTTANDKAAEMTLRVLKNGSKVC